MTVSTTLVSALDIPPRPAAATQSARVVDLVQRRFRDSSYYYLRTITCAFEEGILTLRGRVPSYYLKQIVQTLAEKVDGVQQVINLVDVMASRDAKCPTCNDRSASL